VTSAPIAPPRLLAAQDDTHAFSSGAVELDDWLRRRALANQVSGASRTYVVTSDEGVIGYYALASGGLSLAEAPGRIRRNMPDPIPIVILARLAIDVTRQGQGLGAALLRDAVVRCRDAADIIGVRAIVVRAMSEDAKRFYLRYGFVLTALDPMLLAFPLGAR